VVPFRRTTRITAELLIVARHAESTFSVRGMMNGDPELDGGLTDVGREQARALGRALAGERFDLCAVTEFRRTRETAEGALAGRAVPQIVVGELNDIRPGRWEGRRLDEYRVWAHAHGPLDEPPGGGESRAAAARRFAAGYRRLLERPEATILVVTHGLPIRYVLDAADGRFPQPRADPVPYAQPFRFAAAQLRTAVETLERWAAEPAWPSA
jgi:broad specificity phosphatase PhoE